MFEIRPATEHDFAFLYQLRELALRKAVEAVFGWDEKIQKKICLQEWEEAQPDLIEINSKRVGSYLVQHNSDHIYFGRFYLLPELQGQGLGSLILHDILALAEHRGLPIKLCYLQGNRVSSLYARLGFKVLSEDANFVHMMRPSQ
nr:GNAT family N-acetyltransferase [uncultured Pseudodesulfovibrio sp.]